MNQKGFSATILLIIGVVLIVGLAVLVYLLSKHPTVVSNLIQSPFPTIASNVSKPKLSGVSVPTFQPYSKLEASASSNTKFTDNILNISFKYPQEYKIYSLKAVPNFQHAIIYFLKNKDLEAEKRIKGIIGCEDDNRKNPSGLCTESIFSNINGAEINIIKLDITSLETVKGTSNCETKNISSNKVVISCLNSPANGQPWFHDYQVFIKTDSGIYELKIIATDPLNTQDLIKLIIDSFS